MTSLTMTESETGAWESDDARARDDARRAIRARALGMSDDGETVEIRTADGIVMDAISRG